MGGYGAKPIRLHSMQQRSPNPPFQDLNRTANPSLYLVFDSTSSFSSDTVNELARDCKWKLNAILRTQSFNSGAQLLSLYKAQVLPFIEFRTPAIYHACNSSLENLEHVQSKLLEAAGMSQVAALTQFRLAPLAARRDMALLGLIHRTGLGRGPKHFRQFFRADAQGRSSNRGQHRLQLAE